MRLKLLILLFFICISANSQKYATRAGKTSFIGSEQTFEQIKAVNDFSSAIIDSSSGDIAILLFINAFNFEIALMQEHFNENYMDSSKFPKATFTGNIQSFKINEITDSDQEYKINGVLTIRGIEKEVSLISKIRRSNEALLLKANFSVLTSDFDIKIPKVVRNKISKEIEIKVEYDLVEKI